MKHVAGVLILLMLAGCGTSPIRMTDTTETRQFDRPKVGVVETTTIGDVILAKGTQSVGDAVEILKETKFNKKPGESSIMTCALSVIPEKAFRKGVYGTEDIDAECYGPVKFRRTLADGSTNWNCPGNPLVTGDICKEENGKIFLAMVANRFYLEQDFENIRFVKSALKGKENFVQEIVYGGKSGDILRFVYREYTDNFNKPTFFQAFEFDAASNVIQFREVKIEILDASSEHLTYKVISSFE